MHYGLLLDFSADPRAGNVNTKRFIDYVTFIFVGENYFFFNMFKIEF